MQEKWREVAGYEGLYMISSTGKLARLPIKGRTRNSKRTSYPLGSITKKGYVAYRLYSLEGKHKTFAAHRLVADAFIRNPENKPQVNHKDCNKRNNSVSNLEWVTNAENMAHAVANNLTRNRGEDSGMNKYAESVIREILQAPNKGYRALSVKTGVPLHQIKAIKCGRRWRWLWEEYNA